MADRDVRREVSVVDQPLEVGARTVGRIAGEPFRLKTSAGCSWSHFPLTHGSNFGIV
jgi:hypothetical protein